MKLSPAPELESSRSPGQCLRSESFISLLELHQSGPKSLRSVFSWKLNSHFSISRLPFTQSSHPAAPSGVFQNISKEGRPKAPEESLDSSKLRIRTTIFFQRQGDNPMTKEKDPAESCLQGLPSLPPKPSCDCLRVSTPFGHF